MNCSYEPNHQIQVSRPDPAEPKELKPDLKYYKDPYEAVLHSDALLILTGWPEFRELNYSKIKEMMTSLKIVNGKNILDSVKVKDIGFEYRGIGRD